MRKELKTTFEEFLNEGKLQIQEEDYSGEYYNLYDFIRNNDLQELFVQKYSQFITDLTVETWEDFTRGEIASDEEIIEDLAGNNYGVYYDEDKDIFIVKKKKTNSIKYTIIKSDDDRINNILDKAGIYSEYNPRFAIMLNDTIIGGSTYIIDDDNIYNFDIGILDKYQGYGISKELINAIIYDAKEMKTNGIKAMIVNNALFDYLIHNGFSGSKDGETKYVYKWL